METFFIVLVVVILLIRGLAKLGGADGGDKPRSRSPKKVILPPKDLKKPTRGATHKPASAHHKPGKPKIRRAIFGRRKTEEVPGGPPQGPGSETYIRYLIDVLRVGEPAASRQAVQRLADMGRPALPALQEAARDPSPFVRERAQQATRVILEKLTLPGDPSAGSSDAPVGMPPPREPTPLAPPPRKSPPDDVRPVRSARPPQPEPEPEPVAEEEEPALEPVTLDPGDVAALASIIREAAAEPGFGGRRDEILEPLADAIVKFTVVVDRAQWTGTLGVSPEYRGGRSVGGRMKEAEAPVAVCLPPKRNAWADALKGGESFAFVGVYAGWDGMYDRGKFEGDLLDEPE